MARTALPLAITSGEPSGIGPDICLQLTEMAQNRGLVVIGDKAMLQQRAARLGLKVEMRDYAPQQSHSHPAGLLNVLHVPAAREVRAGTLDSANSRYVLDMLTRAAQGCRAGEFCGMVTAPVHKGVIADTGFPFTGHTEFLAEYLNARQVVMMLVGGGMRVALATTHLALREVPDAITPSSLTITVSSNPFGIDTFDTLTEYQFAGDSEGHGVPVAALASDRVHVPESVVCVR